MTAPLARTLRSALCLLALGAVSASAGAETAHDSGLAQPAGSAPLVPYHGSLLSWEHSATTQTLGVGDTPLSANPTYIMGFVAAGRYYLQDDAAAGKHLSLRLDTGLYRELTNSDATTRRGEWTFSDTDLALSYVRRLRGQTNSDGTLVEVRPLRLTLPTSKISLDSGRYLAAGALLGVAQVSPLLEGRVLPALSSTVRLAVGYTRWFARATVPTNESLDRVRLSPDGRSLPSDALSGSSLVRDQLDFSADFRLAVGERVQLSTSFALSPAWKYSVQDSVAVCGVVLTGCSNVQVAADDSRYLVRTLFAAEVSVALGRGLSVQLGYGNTENQLGSDGRRRSVFYSPDAVFYAAASFAPHELASTSKQVAESHSASPQL